MLILKLDGCVETEGDSANFHALDVEFYAGCELESAGMDYKFDVKAQCLEFGYFDGRFVDDAPDADGAAGVWFGGAGAGIVAAGVA